MEATTTTAVQKALRIPEIVYAIVPCLWEYDKQRQPRLCSLVLVCKDLHEICTPLLWRNIDLTSRGFESIKPFSFSIPSKYSLVEPRHHRRRQKLTVCWFKQGLRKYGSLVRSINCNELREGRYSHLFSARSQEDERMRLKKSGALSPSAKNAEKRAKHTGARKWVLPGDLPAYDFEGDTDDDEMEDKLLSSEDLPKDDGGVKFRTWILKFCPNLEHISISHSSSGMDIYRPFFVEAAKRTMLSSISIGIEDRDGRYSYSGGTLTDFFESLTGSMKSNGSMESPPNKLPGDTNVSTMDTAKDVTISKSSAYPRAGRLLTLSMEDHSYYEGGDDRQGKQQWSHVIRMLDTHPSLQSLRLYGFDFTGTWVSKSSYPAMQSVQINFENFNEKHLSPFLSLFPNLEILDFKLQNMSMKRTLAI
ncbi:hypothetical protein EMPS_11168 [Entomortierella parvispora]|uniref:Uncharacterized protein n=1 Tax=Entomortierella parvispora TaxID=205924 RepID=A0A9P3HL91_9FUNG|nr:hypothetical protein EMPS_11168 [Entomortierella parvispora]